ncbi:MAG: cation transporter [FCB group bacterium]|nr:cation transporter [FCB group bacterium]
MEAPRCFAGGQQFMEIFSRFTNKLLGDIGPDHRRYRVKIGIVQGWLSVVVNGVLFILKLAIGLISHSIAIIADAFHTLSDVVSSIVVIWGFKESEKPADREHPYGHGRTEYIATLIIAILLVVAGIEFIKSSYGRIQSPTPVKADWWMITAVALTILIKEVTARYAEYLSAKISSGTLKADAWHHRTDAISSILVVIAMVAGRYGYYQVDGWAGVGVALFIIWTGFEIARDAVDDLIGKPPSIGEIESIRELAEAVDGVIGAHDISIHSYGADRYASLHIEINANEPPMRAHDIAEEVELKLTDYLGVAPTVHTDPIVPTSPKIQKVQSFLDERWGADDRVSNFHDIRIVDHKYNHVILFGITVTPGLAQKKVKKCIRDIEVSVKAEFPGYDLDIKVSSLHEY